MHRRAQKSVNMNRLLTDQVKISFRPFYLKEIKVAPKLKKISTYDFLLILFID